MTGASPPFPLGVYIGTPNGSDAAAEANFDAAYGSFTSLMGASPKFIDAYVDYTQAIANWVQNTKWQAWSNAQSPSAKSLLPVIGLPMASETAGAATPDQQFQAFASGHYDAVISGIVQAWAQQGFSNLVFRPGWEMNIPGPTYAGEDAQTQGDWVKAFQHIYTVLHGAAATYGVKVAVAWNPDTTNSMTAAPIAAVYPGAAYVDVIAADVYADMSPYSDSATTSLYHDWDTGLEDTSVAQFLADPINRYHYWSHPAATKWSNDSSNGHALSLSQIIALAQAQGKPLAIAETGAGNTGDGTDVSDDAAFPLWLSQEVSGASSEGVQIAFVNIWDSTWSGNYQFSMPSDDKPQEAAAWAEFFGGRQRATVSLGSGPDRLALQISGDRWLDGVQFTISIDGTVVGGAQATTAFHQAAQTQEFDVVGYFGSAPHTATVQVVQPSGTISGSSPTLYVGPTTVDGIAVPGASTTEATSGSLSFAFVGPVAPALDALELSLSEDPWEGDARCLVTLDGKTISSPLTVTALHGVGQPESFQFTGSWGVGAHDVGIQLLNPLNGGSVGRNLYVNSVTLDGQPLAVSEAFLPSNSTDYVYVATSSLWLEMSEDAWQGDAEFVVAVDGTTLGPIQTVTAHRAMGASEIFRFDPTLAPGPHDLAITFLNDQYGGSATADRNLYVNEIGVNGFALIGSAAALMRTSTHHFSVTVA